jgi:hypothetical protein
VLWGINEFVFFLLALLCFLGVAELSFRHGRRRIAGEDDSARAHVTSLQNALLALLGLLLGFTFAMGVSRYDARKLLVVEEANAIDTSFLRAQFLEAPQRHEAEKLLKDYLTARIAFHEAGIDAAGVEKTSAAALRIESMLWDMTVALARDDPHSLPTALFIESLNAAFDAKEKRRAAFDNHVPDAVIFLLFAVASAALGFVAYGCGLAGRRRFGSNAIFALLIALAFTVILDIDRLRRGTTQISQGSIVRLKQTLDQWTRD